MKVKMSPPCGHRTQTKNCTTSAEENCYGPLETLYQAIPPQLFGFSTFRLDVRGWKQFKGRTVQGTGACVKCSSGKNNSEGGPCEGGCVRGVQEAKTPGAFPLNCFFKRRDPRSRCASEFLSWILVRLCCQLECCFVRGQRANFNPIVWKELTLRRD